MSTCTQSPHVLEKFQDSLTDHENDNVDPYKGNTAMSDTHTGVSCESEQEHNTSDSSDGTRECDYLSGSCNGSGAVTGKHRPRTPSRLSKSSSSASAPGPSTVKEPDSACGVKDALDPLRLENSQPQVQIASGSAQARSQGSYAHLLGRRSKSFSPPKAYPGASVGCEFKSAKKSSSQASIREGKDEGSNNAENQDVETFPPAPATTPTSDASPTLRDADILRTGSLPDTWHAAWAQVMALEQAAW